MSQPKTDPTRRTEDGDTNAEQQHPGLHTPPGTGPQRHLSGRDIEADKNVTMPSGSRKEPSGAGGPTAPASGKEDTPTDNRKGGYGAG